jgi:signal transduction histidine kinase
LLLEASGGLLGTLNDLMKIVEVRLNRHIQFDQCVVSEILQKLYASFRAQIIEKEVMVEEDLVLPIISYPKIYLESILHNLIGNAIKYSRPGVRPFLRIRTFLEEGKTVLEVQDNGLGIDLEKYGSQVFKLKKIFHKGFDSKGVGLFITKTQIETFGGEITVKSTPGEGSTFTVIF